MYEKIDIKNILKIIMLVYIITMCSPIGSSNINKRVDQIIKDLDEVIKYVENNGEKIAIPIHKVKLLDPRLTKLRNAIKKNLCLNNFSFNNISEKNKQRFSSCYVCKTHILEDDMRHTIHINMCWLCGEINFNKKNFKKDLTSKIAIVTGGRVKIGYETAIRLLRNNCKVIVTTRFAGNCLKRYMADPDFEKFKNNLHIYQLNMLSHNNIMKFVDYVFKNFEKLDYLINNAAQTIERQKEFYQHVLDDDTNSKLIVHCDNNELKLLDMNNHNLLMNDTTSLNPSYEESKELSAIFPKEEYDEYDQQVDLSNTNSWMHKATDVSDIELVKVTMINSMAPFILATKLKPLLVKVGSEASWIINVSSMEGVFNAKIKTNNHPHTNMAKASLNMFTKTSGDDYVKSNIYMVGVETGWCNYQQPKMHNIRSPLDCADGASRILDPIYRELKKYGIFLKDYVQHPW
jgi:NAD(P)-dependent dehydrogenase (short-subunit alcohol dehydrogenase family)